MRKNLSHLVKQVLKIEENLIDIEILKIYNKKDGKEVNKHALNIYGWFGKGSTIYNINNIIWYTQICPSVCHKYKILHFSNCENIKRIKELRHAESVKLFDLTRKNYGNDFFCKFRHFAQRKVNNST